MIPLDGIILMILSLLLLLFGLYKTIYKNDNKSWIYIVSGIGFFIGLFFSLFNGMSSNFSIINMNQGLHPKLIKILENEEKESIERNNQLITMDAVDKNIIENVQKSGNKILAHHSFGYLRDELGFVGSGGYSIAYKIPFISELVKNVSRTQTITIEEQINAGITNFDIRISIVDKKVYIDHGIIFGEFIPLLEELYNNIPDNTEFTLYLGYSTYNTSSVPSKDLFVELYIDPIAQKYPNKNGIIVWPEYAYSKYIHTSEDNIITQLFNIIKDEPVSAMVSTDNSYIIARSLEILVLTIVLIIIIYITIYYLFIKYRKKETYPSIIKY